jgi:hypothetical protein
MRQKNLKARYRLLIVDKKQHRVEEACRKTA